MSGHGHQSNRIFVSYLNDGRCRIAWVMRSMTAPGAGSGTSYSSITKGLPYSLQTTTRPFIRSSYRWTSYPLITRSGENPENGRQEAEKTPVTYHNPLGMGICRVRHDRDVTCVFALLPISFSNMGAIETPSPAKSYILTDDVSRLTVDVRLFIFRCLLLGSVQVYGRSLQDQYEYVMPYRFSNISGISYNA